MSADEKMAGFEKILGDNIQVMKQKNLIRKALELNQEMLDDLYTKTYPTLSEGSKHFYDQIVDLVEKDYVKMSITSSERVQRIYWELTKELVRETGEQVVDEAKRVTDAILKHPKRPEMRKLNQEIYEKTNYLPLKAVLYA
ncbi:hypothetical protein WR25_26817 [Diploscapter pachys]|uniref:Uncharacterized protein n=1 Tax=Diploscapter pachys TaxID=2018661 RepID=A0A2A2KKY9_9BILA|nr:hypothetical protein WR25_26817 [Diploscapter pachys]